jgi:hypothetical protein
MLFSFLFAKKLFVVPVVSYTTTWLKSKELLKTLPRFEFSSATTKLLQNGVTLLDKLHVVHYSPTLHTTHALLIVHTDILLFSTFITCLSTLNIVQRKFKTT